MSKYSDEVIKVRAQIVVAARNDKEDEFKQQMFKALLINMCQATGMQPQDVWNKIQELSKDK